MGQQFVEFNFTKPPFNDQRIREAASLAIDREIIAHRVMRAGEQPAYAMVPPDMPGYPGKAQLTFKALSMAQRIAKAKALLAEAGYGPQNPLSFNYSFTGQTDVRLVAVALQSMWANIGANVTLVPSDPQVHYNQLRRQQRVAHRGGRRYRTPRFIFRYRSDFFWYDFDLLR